MSGGSKNITRDFLFNWKLYFILISVNVGRAKTDRRFVDQLLWHTREIRGVLLFQTRGMSGGSKNIKQAFLFNLQEQSFYTKQEACQVVLKRAKF
jgi:hypothetical protein